MSSVHGSSVLTVKIPVFCPPGMADSQTESFSEVKSRTF